MRLRDELILREHCKIEEKYFRVHDHYARNYQRSAITGKFYSKYDSLNLNNADNELLQQIRIHRDKGPKNKYSWPATENQIYGWFSSSPLVDTKDDSRFYFPLSQTPITKHGILLKNDRTMKIEKFSGIPFKLQ